MSELPKLPKRMWMRRGEVRDYLNISEQAITKLIANGVLVPMVFKGMKRAFFDRDAVTKVRPEAANKS